jgi:ABC-type transport system involved in multi-copper enzyme maturation permease subunit
MLGPVFWMELHTRSRRRRLFALRTLATIGLSLVLAVVYYNFVLEQQLGSPNRYVPVRTVNGQIIYDRVQPRPIGPGGRLSIQQLAELGGKLFQAYAIGQFILLVGIAPIYCAGCIAGDRERRVLDLVFITRLRNSELVAGKFLARLLELCMLGTTGLPALFLCLLLGGVSWRGLLVVGVLTLAMIAFVASLALVVSIVSARVLSAVVLTYMLLAIIWAGLPIVMLMRQGGLPGIYSPTWFAIAVNPMVGIMSATVPSFINGPGGNPWSDSYMWCIGFYGGVTLLFLLLALVAIRPLGLWASRERVARAPWQIRRARVRRVWNNPVAWREVKTIAVHRRMRWARILALVMLVLVSAPVWVVYLADLLDGHRALAHDINNFEGVIVCTAVIAWLLMALQGSMSFAFERDRSTLDALLTTPLSGRQIVLGKLAGIFRSSTFALVCPLLFIALAWGHGVMSLRAGLLGAAIVLLGALTAAAWGLLCSIATRTTVKAASCAFLAALVLLIGLPLLVAATLNRNLQHELLPATFISPSINLDYAIFERADYTSPYPYDQQAWINTRFPRWDDRLALAQMHFAFAGAAAVVFAAFGMRLVERRHRVGPRRDGLQPSPARAPVARPLETSAATPAAGSFADSKTAMASQLSSPAVDRGLNKVEDQLSDVDASRAR